MNILYLPGLLGSNLRFERFGRGTGRRVWFTIAELAAGGLVNLDLADDGLSPGPLSSGEPIQVESLLVPVYGPLFRWLQLLGHNVVACPFDWRLSCLVNGARLLSLCLSQFGNSEILVIAHSQGGLVARAFAKLMALDGRLSQIRRIITLGTPQYGSWSIVRLFAHIDQAYLAIAGAGQLSYLGDPQNGVKYLDAVLASMPGLYELLPFRRSGPLTHVDPAIPNGLYSSNLYRVFNQSVSQARLDAADAVQVYLQDAVYESKQISIVGNGFQTAYLPSRTAPLYTQQGYLYSQTGDGQVAREYALLPNVPFVAVDGAHSSLPLLPVVWAVIQSNLI
jgi:pimeloyl-ACP methyl ester carboxylesterase